MNYPILKAVINPRRAGARFLNAVPAQVDATGALQLNTGTNNEIVPGKLVLIILPARDQLALAASLLRRSGYEVITTSDDGEGFALAEERRPDLIICDTATPLAGGFDFCRQVRQSPGLSLTALLLVGSSGRDSDAASHGTEAGADGFLPAPYDPMRLVSQVAQLIERKRADHAINQSEERYRDIVENALDMIYSHDLSGKYLTVNGAVERITGYTPEESLAMNMTDTIAPGYVEKAQEMIRRKLAGEKITAYGLEIIAKDGRRVAVEVNTRLVYQDGEVIAVQGIARDVTERRQIEEQLRQAQKMEAIGQLAGGIAHDFNNLLTVITGYSELSLRRLPAEDHLRRHILEIKKAGNRATSLTRQLLAFSRKQVLKPHILGLNSVVANMEEMVRRLIGEHIELRTALAADLGNVRADPGQIEQVIMNLVVNARDAMPHGGNLIIETKDVMLGEGYTKQHISVRPGPYVMIAISDTGDGMDQETQAHIFEPFFTTKESGKGTGLGLSTVYGIVKQSGGNVWVYSEVGRGTTFKIYLPLVEEKAEAYQSKPRVDEMLFGRETVLVAEDDERVRELVCQVLTVYGYQVLQAPDGAAALDLANRHLGKIDLLLTDVVMARMSGRELAEQLEQVRPGVPVLYMSGYTDESIVHHGVLVPETPFLQKPFAPDALARKVKQVLEGRKG
jgi:two-component system cell cycle sensor histidine kinase/response regulator CckA